MSSEVCSPEDISDLLTNGQKRSPFSDNLNLNLMGAADNPSNLDILAPLSPLKASPPRARISERRRQKKTRSGMILVHFMHNYSV